MAWPDRASLARLPALTLSAWLALAGLAQAADRSADRRADKATEKAADPQPARLVGIAGADGRVRMVAHLFTPLPDPAAEALRQPAAAPAGEHRPAILMLNGAGSATSNSRLSAQHQAWGRFWAEHGYLALLLDSSGPRGQAHALDALAWLRRRADVDPARIGLQGWSSSASTVLNLVFRAPPDSGAAPGFRAALALYPNCSPSAWNRQSAKARTELLVLLAGRDDGNATCQSGLQDAQRIGGAINIVLYEDAGPAFDEPAPRRLTTASNRHATRDAQTRAEAFFARTLGP